MEPVSHPTHNFTYRGPEPGIGDLPVHRSKDAHGRPIVASHWRPNDLELQALIAGGTVRLAIFNVEPIPPVALSVEQP